MVLVGCDSNIFKGITLSISDVYPYQNLFTMRTVDTLFRYIVDTYFFKTSRQQVLVLLTSFSSSAKWHRKAVWSRGVAKGEGIWGSEPKFFDHFLPKL